MTAYDESGQVGGASREAPRPPQRTADTAVHLENVHHVYRAAQTVVSALNEVTWAFESGTFTAVMGPSGSGKTTLLQCAAGLIQPSSGSVFLGDQRITDLPERKLATLRRDRVGFVFQDFNLLPALTATENINLPLRLSGQGTDETWMDEVVQRAGIGDRLTHRPHELSGGQQQRVSLCRALITRPQVVCADEPTGALDSRSSREILSLLREAAQEFHQTVILVTHDPVCAAYADQVLFLLDGRITEFAQGPTAESVAATITRMSGGD